MTYNYWAYIVNRDPRGGQDSISIAFWVAGRKTIQAYDNDDDIDLIDNPTDIEVISKL